MAACSLKRIIILKTLILLLTCSAAVLMLLISTVNADETDIVASGTCGENLIWVLNDEGILTISGEGYMEDFEYEDSPWYGYRNAITSIYLDPEVKYIGSYAFSDCSNIAEISPIPGVTRIGQAAFIDCRSLKSISLPYNLAIIEDGAFWGCKSLTDIVIPDSVSEIGYAAFLGCEGITEIDIPSQITTIPEKAFSGCISLTNVNFLDSVTVIEGWAFEGCSNLKSIKIPDCVRSIGMYCFQNCEHLEEIVLPDNLTMLSEGLFYNCSGLLSVEIPETVVKIGDNVFEYCRSIQDIRIPLNTKEIGCCTFSSCDELVSIDIPNCVSKIGDAAFQSCVRLASINVESDNHFYCSIDGVLFNKNCSELICYPSMKKGRTYTIPKTVTKISDNAFSYNAYLSELNVPESVAYIGESAFSFSGLNSVILSSSIDEISDSLFWGCANLSYVNIPASVTQIGSFSFKECISLSSIALPESVEKVGYMAFAECTGLNTITIPASLSELGDMVFDDCCALQSISVDPENTVFCSIDGVLFDKQISTLMIYPPGREDYAYAIPESVTCLADYAFESSKNLVYIEIPETIKSIGAGCFSQCSSLETVSLSDQIAEINDYTFNSCYSLTEIYLPESISTIGVAAFAYCRSLSNIDLPVNVKKLDTFAFYECSSLSSINIPEGLSEYGGVVFDESGIQDVYYDGQKKNWDSLYKYENYEIANLFTVENRDVSLNPDIACTVVPGGVAVTMSSDGIIHYTLDGSMPCTVSASYEGTFVLDEPGEYFINARAFNLEEGTYGPVATEHIIIEQSEKPVISERNGQVMISGEGDIYYSLDLAEDPSTSSYKYSSPLRFDQITVIKAICIEQGKAASDVAGHIYYKGMTSGLSFPSETYSFNNDKKSFGYKGFVYRIPEERYLQIFGNSVGQMLYDIYGSDAWSGSCFGMAATSLLFHKGMLSLADYSDDAETVNALHAPASADSLLTQLIERYQVSQFLPEVMQERGDISDGGNMVISGISGNAMEAEALLEAVRADLAGGDPVILIVWRQDLSGSHAVVPYRVEEGRIYVYDCNDPGKEKYISYRINSGGVYSFAFGEYSYAVSYNRFSVLMNGLESNVDMGNAVLHSDNGKEMILVSADSEDISILDEYGHDVSELINYHATEDMDTDDTVICLEAGIYRIVNNDTSKDSITVSASTESDYQKITVNDSDTVIEVRERYGKICFSVNTEDDVLIESSIRSGSGYEHNISLTSSFAELYSTTDRTVVIRTKAAMAEIDGKTEELKSDEASAGYYNGAAVSSDPGSGARLLEDDSKYSLAADITGLPGEDFNLTVLATGGDENAMLYVASYSVSGRQTGIKGVKMTAGKSRYPFSISKNAAEVKVFMLSAGGARALIQNLIIK